MFSPEFEVIFKIIGGIGAAFVVVEKVVSYSRKLYQLRKQKPPRQLTPPSSLATLKKLTVAL